MKPLLIGVVSVVTAAVLLVVGMTVGFGSTAAWAAEMCAQNTAGDDPAALDDLAADTRNQIVFAPLAHPDDVTVLGDVSSNKAWSTSKVLVAAALIDTVGRGDPDRLTAAQRELITAALTASDMDALLAIRAAIPGSSGSAITRILRSIGDRHTTAPDSNEGGMTWTARKQVRFMAALAAGDVVSRQASRYLLATMRPIPQHSWGLGTIGATAFKGGWLTRESETRQMGIVGGYAVAIITDSVGPAVTQTDGDAAHVEQMNKLAALLKQHLGAAASGTEAAQPDPGGRLSADEVRGLVRANFPAREVGNAMAIAKCESAWTNQAGEVNEDGTRDWGLFQLNDGGTLQGALRAIDVEFNSTAQAQQLALDPDINAKAAAAIYAERGWSPWVCADNTGIVDGLYGSQPGPNNHHYDRNGDLQDGEVAFDRRGMTPADDMDVLGVEGLTPEEQADLAAFCQQQGVGLTGDCPKSPWNEQNLVQNSLWVMRCTHVLFPQIKDIGGWRADGGGVADHPDGRAVDIMMPPTPGYPLGCASNPARTDPAIKPLGDKIATYFMMNAKAYGITYIIWRGRLWNASFEEPTPPHRWRIGGPQSDSDCNYSHWNHVHISVSFEEGTGPPMESPGGANGGGAFVLPTKSSDWRTEADNPSGTDPGMRMHPIEHVSKCHAGWDVAAPNGQPVYAAAAGKAHTSWYGGGGNTVIIDHGGGLRSLSMHLSRYAAGIDGATVRPGQLIGYVGSTGGSTGPHLHFQTDLREVPMDPRHWLFNNTPLRKAC